MAKRKRYPHLFPRHGSPYLYFFWRDENGKRHERSTKKKIGDEETAEQVRVAFLAEIKAGHAPSDAHTRTLKDAAVEWLEFRRSRIAAGSLSSEKTITSTMLRIFGCDTKLKALADIRKVEAYQTARLQAGIKAKSVNNELLVLKGLLERADLWHRLAPKYKKLRVEASDVGAALTEEESKRLIRYAKRADAMAVAPYAAVLALGSGLRDWEIKSLKLADIHLEADRAYVYVRRETTKSDAGARFASLDPLARWAVQKLLARAVRLGSTQPDHYLLPAYMPAHTRSTDPLHSVGDDYDSTRHMTCWKREWDQVRAAIGLEHRRMHDMRHSYVSRAGEAGVPLPVLMAQVGHMSRSTLALYTHVSGRALHDAAERIAHASAGLIAELVEDGEPPITRPIGKARQAVTMERGHDHASRNRRAARCRSRV